MSIVFDHLDKKEDIVDSVEIALFTSGFYLPYILDARCVRMMK